MKRKRKERIITYTVLSLLAVGLIWLIVGLAVRDPNAAGETTFSKSTAFPYDDDNVEIEIEGDPNIDGEKDPAPNNNPNKEPNGESNPPAPAIRSPEKPRDPLRIRRKRIR